MGSAKANKQGSCCVTSLTTQKAAVHDLTKNATLRPSQYKGPTDLQEYASARATASSHAHLNGSMCRKPSRNLANRICTCARFLRSDDADVCVAGHLGLARTSRPETAGEDSVCRLSNVDDGMRMRVTNLARTWSGGGWRTCGGYCGSR